MDYYEICSILDNEIKDILAKRNSYIEKNGYNDTETLNKYASIITELNYLRAVFREKFMKEDE